MAGIVTLNHEDRIAGTVDKYRAVELFPYKIKDVGAFLNQNHPEYNAKSREVRRYWQQEVQRCLEGYWVNDSGVWVFMMPKLYMYINHGRITLTEETDHGTIRNVTSPRLAHLEWIFQSAILAIGGFSGFEEDPHYTCNDVIRKLHNGEEVPKQVLKRALKYGRTPDGDLKRYVDPWEYLTRFYLVDEPRAFSLGKPLYQNHTSNLIAITSRGTHKTFNMAADFVHTFLTNGARDVAHYRQNPQVQIFTGAADSNFLDTFYEVAYSIYDNFSGTTNQAPHPMYRLSTGPWSADKDAIVQRYKPKGAADYSGTKTSVAKGIFKGDQVFQSVSKRNVKVYVDEIGRVARARKAYGTFVNTVKDGGNHFGSICMTGTGGEVEMTVESEFMFTNPKLIRALEISNYWLNPAQKIGLFVTYADTLDAFRDENGNMDILGAVQSVVQYRKDYEREDSSAHGAESLIDMIINEPLDPSEPFKVSRINIFDQARIAERITTVEQHYWNDDTKVKVGRLSMDKAMNVHFTHMPQLRSRVIKDLNVPKHDGDIGELVVFEEPINPDETLMPIGSLYKAVYDPISDKETGSSFASIKVWKGLPSKTGPAQMQNTVVATFKGRRKDPEAEHLIFLMLCRWYHAMGFYENQVSGIRATFARNSMLNYLLDAPIEFLKNVNPHAKNHGGKGVAMNEKLKQASVRWLAAMMNTPVHRDMYGKPFTYIDLMLDLGLLYEMNFYGEGNYDDISAMILLAIWLQHEDNMLAMWESSPVREDQFSELAEAANYLNSLL